MSKKSGRLDLLVRVRYQNPLPPPPYPPKLLTIPTDINRLGEPSYLNHLAASTPLPMLVDSEMGMQLNLNEFDGIWEGQEDSLNPRPDAGRVMHPTDLALLAPLRPSGGAAVNGGPAGAQARDIKLNPEDLATLRTSSKQKSKGLGRRRSTYGDILRATQDVDASEAAQIMTIDSTFFDMTSTNLETFRHPDPKKKNLTVVDSYDILPDDETWANQYMVVKYPERPSAATVANPNAVPSSPRLRKALLHYGQDDEGANLMDFYLPEETDVDRVDELLHESEPMTTERLADLEANGLLGDEEHFKPVSQSVNYHLIRSYEIATVQDQPEKEVLLTLVEGNEQDEADAEGSEPPKKKRKGAYITPISSKVLLRKTRAKRKGDEDARENLWDGVRLGCRELKENEQEYAQEKKAALVELNWTDDQQRKLQGGDNLIVGEGEAIDEDEPLANGDEE